MIKKLQLRVNRDKSSVDRPWRRKFLGFSFTSLFKTSIRVHEKSRENLRKKIKELCRLGRGMNLEKFINEELNPVISGWGNYFRYADNRSFAKEMDSWIRRKLRIILWRTWSRAKVRYKKLAERGIPPLKCYMMANSHKGPYRMSCFSAFAEAYSPQYFQGMGLMSLSWIMR